MSLVRWLRGALPNPTPRRWVVLRRPAAQPRVPWVTVRAAEGDEEPVWNEVLFPVPGEFQAHDLVLLQDLSDESRVRIAFARDDGCVVELPPVPRPARAFRPPRSHWENDWGWYWRSPMRPREFLGVIEGAREVHRQIVAAAAVDLVRADVDRALVLVPECRDRLRFALEALDRVEAWTRGEPLSRKEVDDFTSAVDGMCRRLVSEPWSSVVRVALEDVTTVLLALREVLAGEDLGAPPFATAISGSGAREAAVLDARRDRALSVPPRPGLTTVEEDALRRATAADAEARQLHALRERFPLAAVLALLTEGPR